MRLRLSALLVIIVGTLGASSGVAAASPKLFITHAGVPVPTGTRMAVHFEEATKTECTVIEEGTLTRNQKASDKIALDTVLFSDCASGPPLTGTLGTLNMTWTGRLSFTKAKLFSHTGEPCEYRALELRGEFLLGPNPDMFGSGSGWLQRNVSSVNCTQLASLPFDAAVFVKEAAPGNIVGFEAIG